MNQVLCCVAWTMNDATAKWGTEHVVYMELSRTKMLFRMSNTLSQYCARILTHCIIELNFCLVELWSCSSNNIPAQRPNQSSDHSDQIPNPWEPRNLCLFLGI